MFLLKKIHDFLYGGDQRKRAAKALQMIADHIVSAPSEISVVHGKKFLIFAKHVFVDLLPLAAEAPTKSFVEEKIFERLSLIVFSVLSGNTGTKISILSEYCEAALNESNDAIHGYADLFVIASASTAPELPVVANPILFQAILSLVVRCPSFLIGSESSDTFFQKVVLAAQCIVARSYASNDLSILSKVEAALTEGMCSTSPIRSQLSIECMSYICASQPFTSRKRISKISFSLFENAFEDCWSFEYFSCVYDGAIAMLRCVLYSDFDLCRYFITEAIQVYGTSNDNQESSARLVLLLLSLSGSPRTQRLRRRIDVWKQCMESNSDQKSWTKLLGDMAELTCQQLMESIQIIKPVLGDDSSTHAGESSRLYKTALMLRAIASATAWTRELSENCLSDMELRRNLTAIGSVCSSSLEQLGKSLGKWACANDLEDWMLMAVSELLRAMAFCLPVCSPVEVQSVLRIWQHCCRRFCGKMICLLVAFAWFLEGCGTIDFQEFLSPEEGEIFFADVCAVTNTLLRRSISDDDTTSGDVETVLRCIAVDACIGYMRSAPFAALTKLYPPGLDTVIKSHIGDDPCSLLATRGGNIDGFVKDVFLRVDSHARLLPSRIETLILERKRCLSSNSQSPSRKKIRRGNDYHKPFASTQPPTKPDEGSCGVRRGFPLGADQSDLLAFAESTKKQLTALDTAMEKDFENGSTSLSESDLLAVDCVLQDIEKLARSLVEKSNSNKQRLGFDGNFDSVVV
eukprot:Rmarinus@m.11527